jgi:hypothetical protein
MKRLVCCVVAFLCVAAGDSPAAEPARTPAPTLNLEASLLGVAARTPAPTLSSVVAATDRGVLVARRGSIELFDQRAANVLWDADSVVNPAKIVASADRAVVIDSLSNEIRIVDLATGRGSIMRTGETPIDAIFLGRELYLLERDSRAVERIAADGSRQSVNVAADPAFLREANGRLYVYSRAEGVIEEITTSPFAVGRTARAAPFASDFEVDSRNAYLVYPRGGKIGVVSLSSMSVSSNIPVGAVPVDMAFVSRSTALTARTLAVADPSAKRVWLIEGSQSFTQAVARGFLRGLIGLGLFGGRDSQFPSGIDRLFVHGSRWYAYDSSSGTLYRFTKSKSSLIAKDIQPQSFSVGPREVYVWNDAVRRLQRIDAE